MVWFITFIDDAKAQHIKERARKDEDFCLIIASLFSEERSNSESEPKPRVPKVKVVDAGIESQSVVTSQTCHFSKLSSARLYTNYHSARSCQRYNKVVAKSYIAHMSITVCVSLREGPPKRQMRRLLIVSRRLKQRQDADDEKRFLQATETVWAAMRGHTEGGKMGGQRGNMVGGGKERDSATSQ
ncbi:hypothetical protein R3P38DRAFT_2812805 [Favolaschia claudopus]|uniref:Uncharacterized protein n=1 Tax=Favolaschia claudopus TaxID=2862362 RepID=A0AAV9Z6U9_9AGAR